MTATDGDTMRAAYEAANRSRGDLYVEILRALEKRLGREEAASAMKEAIHAWGRTLGGAIACHAPANFQGVLEDFALAPDGGTTFGARVERCDGGGLDVQFMNCPLKSAWTTAGLPDGEVARLCGIAAEADYGTMDAAGFAVEIETWQPGRDGCCLLHIRPKA
jgi:hypothetical protein